ncbi:hypothetical protein JWS13_27390 [Rhodococcus pseudokoreensis]|uniref:Tocopherol cyclase n=1 Tax=Rhodococcus pseudokoreensis TaxID=2811421 RepID=A0A974W6B9_9NOCA|nr:hypothetical protein [Rhodococcus pseudokoreensis]QSE92093.1 hypothetical protein JWS13_27390 [Rhodococcus pseudokoreensis]
MTSYKLGDFGAHPVVGAFDPDPEDMELLASKHGIGLQATWLYGFFRDADGLTYCAERKFVGSLTSGCFVMTQHGDASNELNVHKDSGRSARGELRRVLEGKTRRWSDPVFQRLPKDVLPNGEQPMELEFTRERLVYNEGDILSLEGPSVGRGVQFFIPSLDRPLLYTSTCFWMEGEFQGKHVSGPIWFDNAYWNHGLEWKEYGYFNDFQIMWHVFCNKFDDGSFEWGHLVSGREGFSPGVVVQSTGEVTATSKTDPTFELADGAWPTKTTWLVDDKTYTFEGPNTGRMTEFSESRWANYRAQLGQTRLDGDTRTLADGLTWNEGFTNRIGPDGKPA